MHNATPEQLAAFLNSGGGTTVVLREVKRIEIDPVKQNALLERQRNHWRKLHTTRFKPEEFELWIQSIPGCSTCQRNLRRHLETLPPRFDDWNLFTWELHNVVNKEIGKPEFSWQEACEKWGWV